MEPLTAGTLATLAFTKAFEKTIEKFTEAALAKIDELRQKILNRLRGEQRSEAALTAVEQGNKSELQRVAIYLEDAMREAPQLAGEVLSACTRN